MFKPEFQVNALTMQIVLSALADNAHANGNDQNQVRVSVVQGETTVPFFWVTLALDSETATFVSTGDTDCTVNTGSTGIVDAAFVDTSEETVTVTGTGAPATPGNQQFSFVSATGDVYAFTNISANYDHQTVNEATVQLTRNHVPIGGIPVVWTLTGRPSVHFFENGIDKGQTLETNTESAQGGSTVSFQDTDTSGYGGPIDVSVHMKTNPAIKPDNDPRTFHFNSLYTFDPIQPDRNGALANGTDYNRAIVKLKKGSSNVSGTQIAWKLTGNPTVHFINDQGDDVGTSLPLAVGSDGTSAVRFVDTDRRGGSAQLGVSLSANEDAKPANSPLTFTFAVAPDQYTFNPIDGVDGQPADGSSKNRATVKLLKNGGNATGTRITWRLDNNADVQFVDATGTVLTNPQTVATEIDGTSTVYFTDANRSGGTVQVSVFLESDPSIKPSNSPRTFTFAAAPDHYTFDIIRARADGESSGGIGRNEATVSLLKNGGDASGTSLAWRLYGNSDFYFVDEQGTALSNPLFTSIESNGTSTVSFKDANRSGGTVPVGVALTSDTNIKPSNSPRTFTFAAAADQYVFDTISANKDRQPGRGIGNNEATVSLTKNGGNGSGTSITWRLDGNPDVQFVDEGGHLLGTTQTVNIGGNSASTVRYKNANPSGGAVRVSVFLTSDAGTKPSNSPRPFTFVAAPDQYTFSTIGPQYDGQPADGTSKNSATVTLHKNGGDGSGTSVTWRLDRNPDVYFVNAQGAALTNPLTVNIEGNSSSTVYFRDSNRGGGSVQVSVFLASDPGIKPSNSPRTFTFSAAATLQDRHDSEAELDSISQ